MAQALYERHKVLTYPRTDSRHLSTDMAGELPKLFAALAALPDYAPLRAPLLATRPPRSRRVVDDGKVQDHHAIIPTGQGRCDLDELLDRDERRMFDLVARRFLGAFYPDAEFALHRGRDPGGRAARAGAGARARRPREARRTRRRRPRDEPLLDALPPPPDRFLARGRVRLVRGLAGGRRLRRRAGGTRAATTARSDGEPAAAAARRGAAARRRVRGAGEADRPPPRHTEATLLGGDGVGRPRHRGRGAARGDEGLAASARRRRARRPSRRCSSAASSRATARASSPTAMGIGAHRRAAGRRAWPRPS